MKIHILLLFFALTTLLSACKTTSDHQAKKPNILFIMSDDHSSQAWGIYEGILQDYVQNKNIKRLAREGAVLENVFCTNSICVPSRASIMTGLYSHENSVYTLSDSLRRTELSIASALQKENYQTAIIGKWHLKEIPQGFDYVKVLPGQGRYNNPVFRTSETWNNNANWEQISGFSSDVIADESIKWMEEKAEDKPFFLMTHFKATHEPFDYPERLATLYRDDSIPEPSTLWDYETRVFEGQQLEILGQRYENSSSDSSFWARYPGLPVTFPIEVGHARRSRIYQKFIKDFMRSGAAIDDNIGKLLNYLDDKGLADNTIVIYTSDQGYFLGEHGFFDKRIMYEEALRMPFVIRYPREIRPGSSVSEMILNVDFASLFLDYASSKDQSFGSGRSFRSILQGLQIEDWRNEMYYRYWQHLDIRPAHYGIRTEQYKLIYFYGKPLGMAGAMEGETKAFWEFYDLKNDPFENQNLINAKEYQIIINDLKLELDQLQKKVGDQAVL